MAMKDWLRGNRDKGEGADAQADGVSPEAEDGQQSADQPDDSGEQAGGTPPGGEPPSVPPTGGSGGTGGIPITLADITRGMQHAASSANQLIARQYMQALEPFFELDDDGKLIPKAIEMKLDEQHHFQLPLVALATPRGLMLEKMKVFLTVRTDAVEQHAESGTSSDAVSKFHVSMSPSSRDGSRRDSGHVDIEMQFTVLEPPESVMRLIDEYTNQVLPKQTERTENNG